MNKVIEFKKLIEREGVYYLQKAIEPFTGKVTGIYSGSMIDGLPSGVWEEYDNNTLLSKSTYDNGKLDGKLINYYRNGSIKEIGYVKNNRWVGKYHEYYDNRNIREKKNYIDGKLEGRSMLYYKNRQIKESKFYKNDKLNSEYLYYYSNGYLWIKSNYNNGKLDGDRFIYYEDGKLEKKEFYRNGINTSNRLQTL